MKLPVPQETDWIKRGPPHQFYLTDRLRHVLTGAMHEETCILGVLTLRDNTERPENVGGVECACGDGGDNQMRPEHA